MKEYNTQFSNNFLKRPNICELTKYKSFPSSLINKFHHTFIRYNATIDDTNMIKIGDQDFIALMLVVELARHVMGQFLHLKTSSGKKSTNYFHCIGLLVALARQEMGDRVKSDLRCRETPEAVFFPFSADVTGKKDKRVKG